MSSGFVSGGTTDAPIERDDDWKKAQEELEANRRRKEEQSRQEGGKSLYETLQANKAAKQEAFEESIRLKNQFRSLDEDEVDFLDSVLESTRAKEEAVRRETTEQLDHFRRQQEEADKVLLAEAGQVSTVTGGSQSPPVEEEQWVISGRKRKKGKDKEVLKGVKLRKSSSTNSVPSTISPKHAASEAAKEKVVDESRDDSQKAKDIIEKAVVQPRPPTDQPMKQAAKASAGKPATQPAVLGLGLGGYSSDDDD
ncbi:MAG: hypothetical protein M1819_000265 [Sarea resinae]|nr:MAG: hypothetical protein M1819_000265 [Sarea resinae]